METNFISNEVNFSTVFIFSPSILYAMHMYVKPYYILQVIYIIK